jgi:hypothetical protein
MTVFIGLEDPGFEGYVGMPFFDTSGSQEQRYDEKEKNNGAIPDSFTLMSTGHHSDTDYSLLFIS